ncbi:hypothetical protein [Ammoniphilus sp. CFH 90114]|uniref:hypothetical protein n=1 Tax=Ammoniphilus sp. CFH 90114 TaxID=2493665 RepID=UPI0013E8FCF8|nr:hypothetical protein [Ammoniphilus sp. CFH 90114]
MRSMAKSARTAMAWGMNLYVGYTMHAVDVQRSLPCVVPEGVWDSVCRYPWPDAVIQCRMKPALQKRLGGCSGLLRKSPRLFALCVVL